MALYTLRTSDLAMLLTGAVTVGILACVTVDLATERKPAEVKPAEVITEDDPRWDCATMGNRICGDRVNLEDPYTRCVLALDGAEVPLGICDPLLPTD